VDVDVVGLEVEVLECLVVVECFFEGDFFVEVFSMLVAAASVAFNLVEDSIVVFQVL
jgi:hypothetical protein